MCKKCVAEGLLTAEQLERINAGEDPGDVLTPDQVDKLSRPRDSGEDVTVNMVNLDEAPDFIKRMIRETSQDTRTPAETAQEKMDKVAELALGFINNRVEAAERDGLATSVDLAASPELLDAFLENLAGQTMYRTDPATVAYAFNLLSYRYASLLEQWATLYVAACEGDPEIDLDQAKTPESKAAVTKAADAGTRAPGFYL